MKRDLFLSARLVTLALAAGLAAGSAFAVTPAKHRKKAAVKTVAVKTAVKRPVVARGTAGKVAASATLARTARKRVWVQTWDEPTYKDSTLGDKTEGEDPIVRQA